VIIIITYLIGLGGFAHIIAGSIETSYVVMLGEASWGTFFENFFIPALLGTNGRETLFRTR
jgi:formate/nitrite transporter FocA (FNT family)